MRNFLDDLLEQRLIRPEDVAPFKLIDITNAAAQFQASFPLLDAACDVTSTISNAAPPLSAIVFSAVTSSAEAEHLFYGRFATFMLAADVREEQSDAKWRLWFRIVAEHRGWPTRYPVIGFDVSEDGTVGQNVYRNPDEPVWLPKVPVVSGDIIENEVNLYILSHSFIAPCLFALSLMHTKNCSVVRMPVTVPHSRKVRKRRAGLPTLDHHEIVIRDRQGWVVDSAALGTGRRNGMHIVRGHFATYTPDAPLFGKVTGRFWIPAHIRGLESERVITSEYRV